MRKIIVLLSLFSFINYTYAANNYPDTFPEAQSLRTPYTMKPISPIQLGVPANANPGTVTADQHDVYSALWPYFKVGASTQDPGNLHFDFNLFKSMHSISQPTNSPWSYTAGATSTELRVYFIDTQTDWKNALGVINQNQYSSGQPLQNMGNTNSLIFPMAISAEGESLARFIGTTTNPNTGEILWNAADEHPLLLSDAVDFTVAAGQTVDFFLLTNLNNINLDTQPPGSADQVWFSSMEHNYVSSYQGGNPNNPADQQHFQFYNLPELGSDYKLVAVENTKFQSSDMDFNDLLFIIRCAPVPEPETYMLIGTLLALAFAFSWKKRASIPQ